MRLAGLHTLKHAEQNLAATKRITPYLYLLRVDKLLSTERSRVSAARPPWSEERRTVGDTPQ